ncbi:MAG: cytochrome c [Gammaproteobacteria bacterium]|nr:cytochrome c [Gammaproteobacteria bacterium]
MIRFRKLAVLAAACIVAVGLESGVQAQGGDEAAIKYRQNIMKSVGGHTGAIAQVVKGESPHKAHLERHARALHDLLSMAPDAFRQQTSGGDTRAKPEIWSDSAGFKRAADEAVAAASAFVEASASGDEGAIGEKIKAVFDGCKGCHRDYREKKE